MDLFFLGIFQDKLVCIVRTYSCSAFGLIPNGFDGSVVGVARQGVAETSADADDFGRTNLLD
jgi:hypothetical protein